MLEGFLFKNKKNGINHIAIGIDECKSLCGAAYYSSKSISPHMKKVGEKMTLDDLIIKYTKYCSRCVASAEKQIESEMAYRRDSLEAKKEQERLNPKSRKPRYVF